VNESLLVNTLGHSAGVLIFGIFLYLLIQDRPRERGPGGTKPVIAAALAIVWNLASLFALRPGSGDGLIQSLAVAVGFSVLSLLPAVLFDLCLEDGNRTLVRLGYALSAVAVALHVAELFARGDQFHRWGLILITAGFGLLTIIAALPSVLRPSPRGTTSRLVGTMLLFLLAMSFVHFRGEHINQVWSQELAFHHAAIPLALLILLQDYRFVLLDAFVRFLANVFLAAIFVFAAVALWRTDLVPGRAQPFEQALLLVGACLLLITFALARSWLERALTGLVFRRADEAALIADLKAPVRDEEEYLQRAAALVGQHVGASAALSDSWPSQDGRDLARPALVSELSQGIEVVVPIRTARKPRSLLLGRRSGGRRYLSEDLLALGRAAIIIVDQIEQFREAELRRLVTLAELRALQSQIHPHFLFNALNALYGIIPREAKSARETVLNLSDIFRYSLETGRMLRPLSDEMRIIKAYLEVERLRLGNKLRVEIDIASEALEVHIPVLSIQPLVENAIKHGIAPNVDGGLVRVEVSARNGAVRVMVRDSGPGFAAASSTRTGAGVGLDNVARRLDLCFGAEAALNVESDSSGTTASFLIPAALPALRSAEAT
jgi:two-component system LytT family sensor kinase